MSRSRRVNRSSESGRSSGLAGWFAKALQRVSRPSRLVREAGRAGGFVEQLEKRELLFSLTITPSDAGPDGIGTVEATFAYAMPYLAPTVDVGTAEAVNRVEDFQDETARLIPQNGPPLPGSFFRINHNITPAGDVRIIENAPPGDGAKFMQVRQDGGGEFWQLRFSVSQEVPDAFLAATSISFTVDSRLPGGPGLLQDNYLVELLFLGGLIASFTGDELRAINPNPRGVGQWDFTGTAANPAFDAIRITALVGGNDAYRVDDISANFPPGNFAPIVGAHVRGATIVFSGPIGSSAQVLDLYGNEMVQTIAAGIPPSGAQVTLIDPDDDGRPNFNDGIGKIILRGTDSRSAITMWGSTITPTTEPPPEDFDPRMSPDGFFFQQGFLATLVPSIQGDLDAFETVGFGYAFDGIQRRAIGLPPGPGSLIIGAPFIRDRSTPGSYNPGGVAPGGAVVTDGFNRPDQGIFVLDGASMGSVQIHGVVHGSSNFTGALDRFIVGYLVGSVGVAGDLGLLVSGSDAGLWVPDPIDTGPLQLDAIFKTRSQLVVGRTVGQINIAGRSLLDVTIQGDMSTPQTRPARNVFNYSELEFTYGFPTTATVLDTIEQTMLSTPVWGVGAFGTRGAAQAVVFGDSYLRNDSLLSAEWIGNSATGVSISGELGFGDPVNTAEDTVDVYAFATDGLQPVIAQFDAISATNLLIRIMDINGRTVAANNLGQRLSVPQFLTFNPDSPGIYYLVISAPGVGPYNDGILNNGGFPISGGYSVTVTGLASTTLGSYRTGAGSGQTGFGTGFANTINLLSGSMGSIRVGTGWVNGGGTEQDPQVVFNTEEDEIDDIMSFRGGTFSVPGNLYNITAGSDIESVDGAPINIFVGGNFGSLITGRSTIPGTPGPTEGDVTFFNLTVAGSIAVIDIKGGISIDQDDTPFSLIFPIDNVNIITGTGGGRGDIGVFRTGSHILGDALNITTSPGSIIGAFLVSQDVTSNPTDDRTGIFQGDDGVTMTTGTGSDVRFISFPRLDLRTTVDAGFNLFGNTTLEIIDDGGAVVRIRPVNVPAGFFVGRVQALPIDGSEGMAIGDITIDLSQGLGGLGGSLEIEGVGPVGSSDIISIGRIVITGSGANSGVTLKGNVQVDVWRLVQTGGQALSFVRNETPMGDFVAVDVIGLTRLDILTGDLGRTQVPAWGPKLIGPFLGIAQNAVAAPNGALGIAQNAMHPFWGGQLYRAPGDMETGIPNARTEDLGSPFDPYLNGLVVRTGNLDDLEVGGAVGDVIVQNGDIVRLTANFDRKTPTGRFDGIIGSVYANNIFRVAIGDGLLQRELDSPFATTGIFAADDVVQVLGQDIPGQYISSVISSSNNVIEFGDPSIFNGIDVIDLQGGGDYIDVYISAQNIDAFWTSSVYGEGDLIAGDIRSITGQDADMFRTQIFAGDVLSVLLQDGFYDASSIRAVGGTVTRVEAAGYRNSTLTGTDLEFRVNEIFAGLDIVTITTTGKAGDIVDLVVDVVGGITGEISARNIIRTKIDVDNTLVKLEAVENMRSSSVIAGQLTKFSAGRNVQSSAFRISGPIADFSAGNAIINTSIDVTGPFGRIDKITAPGLISGSITSTGPILNITSTAGDIVATITTTTGRGDVALLQAGRDLNINTDIAGTLSTLTAGRHIGDRASPGVILVRGNLLDATMGGQLYSDLRVGQSITGTVTIGPVSRLPGNDQGGSGSIIAFGAINAVNVIGDFGGDIISYSGGIKAVAISGGSFLPGRTIAAYDGSIEGVLIVAGNLYGNIHADYMLVAVRVEASADGVFGDIGVNPFLIGSTPYDALRNQLPVGVVASAPIQGPRISAGQDIGSIVTTNGSMFEATVYAGRVLGAIEIHGDVRNDTQTPGRGTLIAAGDVINGIGIFGDLFNAHIIAGLLDLGADNRPGGKGANADTVKSGFINAIGVVGNTADVVFAAGMNAWTDGLYGTPDDHTAIGQSAVGAVNLMGAVDLVSVYSDAIAQPIVDDARITKGGLTAANEDPQIAGGGPFGTPIIGSLAYSVGGDSGMIFFSGPGEAFFDAAAKKIVLVNTTMDSALSISSDTFTVTDFDIVSNDDASIGTLFVGVSTFGDSDIIIDGSVGALTIGHVDGTGTIRIGGDLGSFLSGNVSAGRIEAKNVGGLVITGDFGSTDVDVRGEAVISVYNATSITVGGANRAAVNVERDLGGFVVNGAMQNATLRAGSTIGSVSVAALLRSWISARDVLVSVAVAGDMFDSSIVVGGDLGSDTEFGGTGLAAADRATTGAIGTVTVGGNFLESDVIAGSLRGPDGFFGTSDDLVADGRSSIDAVIIGGTQVGSTRQSEAYRISSTGFLGSVTLGGLPAIDQANFKVERPTLMPLAIQVTEIQVTEDSRIYSAKLIFNQPINASTLPKALDVSEIRDRSDVTIRLIPGIDYTLSYDAATNSAILVFNRTVTGRDLPQLASRPGPGVYRFDLLQNVLRAQLVNQRLDGNGDGFAQAGDDFSKDDVVGDAGDKLFSERDIATSPGGTATVVDIYAPFSLDFVFDNNHRADGLAEANTTFTLRGSIGDHTDNDINNFRFAGDLDIFSLTLQAGQILRLGANSGPALLSQIRLLSPDGDLLPELSATADVLALPVERPVPTAQTVGHNYLIKTTGTYYLMVGNAYLSSQLFDEVAAGRMTFAQLAAIDADEGFAHRLSGFVPNLDPVPGGLGDYAFTINIFDDLDSGFSAPTDAGDGSTVANAPAPSSFAGGDLVLGTADDIGQISIGSFVFTLSAGPDGAFGTADDLVTGSTPHVTSSQTGDGRLTTVINGSIGPANHSGVPTTVFPDADVYHLNNRTNIAPGTRMRITVRLNEFGTDLGSRNQLVFGSDQFNLDNFRGAVQFGVFDTTNSVRIDDGSMIFSPTDFSPNGGAPNTVLASNATSSYGYDANGDFFIDFLTPGRPGPDGKTGTADDLASRYAIYLQGVYSGDYQIQVDTVSPTAARVKPKRQNILLETRGGTINWLERGGLTTKLAPFSTSPIGFSGGVPSGQSVDQYVLTSVRNALQSIFNAANLDVRFSTNPADFEFQQFSTVYLSSTVDPISLLFNSYFDPRFLLGLTDYQFFALGDGFFGLQPYGFAEHSDAMNTDLSDEAVVFVPSMALLSYTPDQADIDLLASSTTAAVARRVGELMGLRISNNNAFTSSVRDPFSADSVIRPTPTGAGFILPSLDRLLSNPFDSIDSTDFFLGAQNARATLARIAGK